MPVWLLFVATCNVCFTVVSSLCDVSDCTCIELVLWWIALACLLIKTTVLNHTTTTWKTATSYPHDDDYGVQ